MSRLRHVVQAVIYPDDEAGYVAECLDLAVVTQGDTLDETVRNLREAIQLYLEGEDLTEFRLESPVFVREQMELSAGVPMLPSEAARPDCAGANPTPGCRGEPRVRPQCSCSPSVLWSD